MLWLLLFLLMAALGVLWWRFAMPSNAGGVGVPPILEGNHPSLRTRHYRLADFHPAPLEVPPAPGLTVQEEAAARESPAPPESLASESVGEETPPHTPAPDEAMETTPEAGRLPMGALHNYLTAPAPTATDEHNRGVELTAAGRRAKMRALMNEALENRRATSATA
jgi:hypothetical protein